MIAIADAAIALWLWFARCSFVGAPFRWWPDGIGIALAAAVLVRISGLGLSRGGRFPVRAAQAGAVGLGLAALIGGAAVLHLPAVGLRAALWYGIAAGALLFGFRTALGAARRRWPDRPGEFARWLLVGAGATAVMLPYYRRGGLGAGDAYWYTIMLADFVAQIRHGVFPVWVGQSEFAFNGAVSPLRIAPWFQHMGGLLDGLTARSLEPAALKNALLCVNAFAVAGAAYFGLRTLLQRRPGIAAVLALLWLASPGVLAPLYLGDQYMTFMAMPFLPVLLTGLWRLWQRDDAAARCLIVAGLAGLWLSHTPMALWGSMLAAGMYAGHRFARGRWGAEVPRLAWMAALFLVLGSLPVASGLAIDNPNMAPQVAEQAFFELEQVFPDNFKPIDVHRPGQANYQLGYALTAAGAAAIILLAWLRPRGGAAFAVALPAVALFVLPVPGVTHWIWKHIPALFATINNIWPMQRLFALWGALAVFALALAVSDERIAGRSRRAALVLALLAAAGVWSASEAVKLFRALGGTMAPARESEILLRPENLRLTRYPYASFASVPEYVSHGYMDPLLENRLLARDTLAVTAANADWAAPRPGAGGDPPAPSRLVQSGTWVGTSDNHTGFYPLRPRLVPLDPGRRYALRIGFSDPLRTGYLQITGDGLFREYMLPDSGVGLGKTSPSLAFGSQPDSGNVVPLQFHAPGPVMPAVQFIQRAYEGEKLAFGRFWLFSYNPSDLPINVRSWIPYRAEVTAASPSYAETPRVWQRGWQADVNGRKTAVARSPHNLAMVPVGPGSSTVTLTFHAPLWLRLLFWLHLAGWTALLVGGAARFASLHPPSQC